jgi:hypothetical protein
MRGGKKCFDFTGNSTVCATEKQQQGTEQLAKSFREESFAKPL